MGNSESRTADSKALGTTADSNKAMMVPVNQGDALVGVGGQGFAASNKAMMIPVNQLDALVGVGGWGDKYQPYDVFLVSTGEQKHVQVDTMANFLEREGMRCFFDLAMMNHDGLPLWQMRSALLSCRYAVAIVSRTFLQKRDPMQELEYAFRREKWMQTQKLYWPSLRIVLFDLSVEEFKKHSQLTRDITREIVLLVFDYSMKWSQLCGTLVDSVQNSDRQGAVTQWTEFLEQLGSYEQLPLPKRLYEN